MAPMRYVTGDLLIDPASGKNRNQRKYGEITAEDFFPVSSVPDLILTILRGSRMVRSKRSLPLQSSITRLAQLGYRQASCSHTAA